MSQGQAKAKLRHIAPEAERALVASVFARPSVLLDVADRVSTEAFTVAPMRETWAAMLELLEDGIAVSTATLTDRLMQRGTDAPTAARLVDELDKHAYTAGDPGQYVDEVLRVFEERRVRAELAAAAASELSAEDLKALVYQRLESTPDSTITVLTGADFARIVHTDLEDGYRHTSTGQRRPGVYTGFFDLDEQVAPFSPGDLVILGAATSMGKTAFFTSMVHHWAGSGVRAGYISLEDGVIQIGRRFASRESGVAVRKLKTADLTPDEYRTAAHGLQRLSQLRLYAIAEHGLTGEQIASRIRFLRARHQIDVVCVDYLQQVRDPDPGRRNRHLELSDALTAIKGAASKCGIPLFVGSQLTKDADGNRPTRKHLKESGDILNKAEYILLLYQDRGKDEDIRRLEVIVDKAKDAALRDVDLGFHGATTSVVNFRGYHRG